MTITALFAETTAAIIISCDNSYNNDFMTDVFKVRKHCLIFEKGENSHGETAWALLIGYSSVVQWQISICPILPEFTLRPFQICLFILHTMELTIFTILNISTLIPGR